MLHASFSPHRIGEIPISNATTTLLTSLKHSNIKLTATEMYVASLLQYCNVQCCFVSVPEIYLGSFSPMLVQHVTVLTLWDKVQNSFLLWASAAFTYLSTSCFILFIMQVHHPTSSIIGGTQRLTFMNISK